MAQLPSVYTRLATTVAHRSYCLLGYSALYEKNESVDLCRLDGRRDLVLSDGILPIFVGAEPTGLRLPRSTRRWFAVLR